MDRKKVAITIAVGVVVLILGAIVLVNRADAQGASSRLSTWFFNSNSELETRRQSGVEALKVNGINDAGATRCLQVTSDGVIDIASDACGTGGGGGGAAWTAITGAIYNSTTTDQVLIGNTSTTSTQKLEVIGGGYFSGTLGVGTTTPFANLSIDQDQGEIAFAIGSSTETIFIVNELGQVGIGTTTPSAMLSVWGDGTGTDTLVEFVNNASSTLFNILENGNVGVGTTSPGSLLSLGDTGNDTININTTATSTFGSGIDIRTGCFAINGTCVGGGGGGAGFGQAWEVDANGDLAPTTTIAVSLPSDLTVTGTSTLASTTVSQLNGDIYIDGINWARTSTSTQNAVDACIASEDCGTVYLSPGVYEWGNPVNLSDVRLVGSGATSTILRIHPGSIDNFGFQYILQGSHPTYSGDNVYVSDITLDGNFDNLVAPAANRGGGITPGENWEVERVIFDSSNYFMFFPNGTTDVILRDAIFRGNGIGTDCLGGGGSTFQLYENLVFEAGIDCNAFDHVNGQDVTVRNARVEQPGADFFVEGMTDTTIEDSYFVNADIIVQSNYGYTGPTVINNPEGINIRGNRLVDGGFISVKIQDESGHATAVSHTLGGNNTVEGNYIEGASNAAILFHLDVRTVDVGGNVIANNTIVGANQSDSATWNTGFGISNASAINVMGTNGVAITGNSISATTTPRQHYGIQIGQTLSPSNADVENVTIAGNSCRTEDTVSGCINLTSEGDINQISYWGADASTTAAFIKTGNLGIGDVTPDSRISIINASTTNALVVNQDDDTGADASVDGAVLIENTGNTGIGLSVYSNQASPVSGPGLVSFVATNPTFSQEVLTIQQDGTNMALLVDSNNAGNTQPAVQIDDESTNSNFAALDVRSPRSGQNVFFRQESGSGKNLHLDTNGNGTSQFIDSEATSATGLDFDFQNTSGLLADWSHNLNSLFTLDFTGKLGLLDSSPDARLEIVASSTDDLLNITSNGGSDGDLITVDSSGNFGIATTSPYLPLSVVGTSTIVNTNDAFISTFLHLENQTGQGGGNAIDFQNQVTNGVNARIHSIRTGTTNAPTDLVFSLSDDGGATLTEVHRITTATTSLSSTGGIDLTGGCFAINGTCLTSGSGSGTVNAGTTGQIPYYAANGDALTATSTIVINTDETVTVGGDSLLLNTSAGNLTLQASGGGSNEIIGTGFLIYDVAAGSEHQFEVNNSAIVNVSSTGIGVGGSPGELLDLRSGTDDIAIEFADSASQNFTVGIQNGTQDFQIADSAGLGTDIRFIIDQDGNIGFGTSSPLAQLTASTTNNIGFLVDQRGTSDIAQFQDAGSTVFTIQDGGNVGIGTTSPFAKLSVEQDQGEVAFAIGSSTATSFIVNADGDVGVGTDSPSNPLHVVGSIFVETIAGDLTFLASGGGSNEIKGTGFIDYNAGAASGHTFSINGAELWRFDSSGRLGFGGTAGNLLDLRSGTLDVAIEFADSASSNFTIGTQNSTDTWQIADGSALGTDVRLLIDGSGLVGIGNTTPGNLLTVNGTASALNFVATSTTATSTLANTLAITANSGTASSVSSTQGGTLQVECTNNPGLCASFYTNQASPPSGDGFISIRVDNASYGQEGVFLNYDGTNKALFVDANNTGNIQAAVQIDDESTNSNFAALDVRSPRGGQNVFLRQEAGGINLHLDTNGNGQSIFIDSEATSDTGLDYDFQNTSGLIADWTHNNNSLFTLDFRGRLGLLDSSPDARLEIVASSTDDLLNLSSAVGADGDLVTVDSSGNVGIGSTSPGTFDLAVGDSGLNSGDTTFTNTSHSSFKENIETVNFGKDFLERFLGVEVKTFNFTEKYIEDRGHEGDTADRLRTPRIGLLADEFNPLLGKSSDTTTISGDERSFTMWEAIRQLILRVFDHEKRIDALEKENEALKARLDALEAQQRFDLLGI